MAGILDAVFQRPRLLWLLLTAIREYETADQLEHGRGGGAGGFGKLIAQQDLDRRERGRAQRLHGLLRALYLEHDAGQVRGALLEVLARQQIATRYSGPRDLCGTNHKLRISNGNEYTTSRSLDVFGWDGTRGEALDCKANARAFDRDWLDELEQEVHPRGVAVGLVTADHSSTARRKLEDSGVRTVKAVLVSGDALERRDTLPLS